jgi:crotonobetainyl-CoA:carnitine CoA-transferase CaiB-like acyl-CoA transferase
MLVDVEDPVVGTLKLVGNPLKIEPGLPRPSKRIPGLGEHTASVLAELAHVTDDELAELRAAGAVGPFRGSDAGVAAR